MLQIFLYFKSVDIITILYIFTFFSLHISLFYVSAKSLYLLYPSISSISNSMLFYLLPLLILSLCLYLHFLILFIFTQSLLFLFLSLTHILSLLVQSGTIVFFASSRVDDEKTLVNWHWEIGTHWLAEVTKEALMKKGWNRKMAKNWQQRRKKANKI